MILSASRRTDIPSFYSQWFMNRLKEGFVLAKNPMNANQISRITLSPETIDCIVFWSKDPMNMIDKLQQIDDMGYRYYFQFTLTPYGNEIERNIRDKKDIVKTFQRLSSIIGKERVLWRYDPILLNDEITIDYHINHFTELCRELQGYTEICNISFVDIYSKLSKAVKEGKIRVISDAEMHQLSASLSEIGRSSDIELRACCENLDLSADGIKPASCIDQTLIERIFGHKISGKQEKTQRLGCRCIKSVDIGVYNTCTHGCVYCYANHSEASIHKNNSAHNPDSPILIGEANKDWRILDRT